MKHYLICFSLMALSVQGAAQKLDVDIKDLVVPASPAFTVLDFSPRIIERPATIKAFALNVVNQVGESAGFPKNFATEFAPYWLFENYNMDIFKYYGIKHNDSAYLGQDIFSGLRSTSLSLGSLFRDSSKKLPIDVNYLSYGVRSNVIAIRDRFVLRQIHDRVLAINQLLGEHLSNIDCDTLEGPARLECLGKKLEKELKGDSVLTSLRQEFSALTTLRPIFALDLAFASSTAFGNGSITHNKMFRTGGWATFAVVIPLAKKKDVDKFLANKNFINGFILVRSISENQTLDFQSFVKNKFFDFGGRAELELNRLSISIESIHRSVSDKKNLNTSRTVGIIQYRITDNLYVSGTFGKDFGDIQNVISVLGLNWGFGGNSLFQSLR